MKNAPFKSLVYAKLNLSLKIKGSANGLHVLDSTVCPYFAYSDTAEFFPADISAGLRIETESALSGFDEKRFLNFFRPKAEAIAKRFEVGGLLKINKGVPLGAGLGGSSASVAAALNVMRQAAEKDKSIALDTAFLLKLGSDVPCMLYGRACRMTGVGEGIKPVEIPINCEDICVRIADGGSDTAACYALYDRLFGEGKRCFAASGGYVCEPLNTDGGAELFKNDLTLAATTLNKNINSLIEEMAAEYKYVAMSGSGSAVLGYLKK